MEKDEEFNLIMSLREKSRSEEMVKFIDTCIDSFGYDFSNIWHNCKRLDWLLWIAEHLNLDKKIMTAAKVICFLERVAPKIPIRNIYYEYLKLGLAFANGEISEAKIRVAYDELFEFSKMHYFDRYTKCRFFDPAEKGVIESMLDCLNLDYSFENLDIKYPKNIMLSYDSIYVTFTDYTIWRSNYDPIYNGRGRKYTVDKYDTNGLKEKAAICKGVLTETVYTKLKIELPWRKKIPKKNIFIEGFNNFTDYNKKISTMSKNILYSGKIAEIDEKIANKFLYDDPNKTYTLGVYYLRYGCVNTLNSAQKAISYYIGNKEYFVIYQDIEQLQIEKLKQLFIDNNSTIDDEMINKINNLFKETNNG